MPKVIEYKDKRGEWRIKQKSNNGKVTDSTHESYHNLKDARETRIKTSTHYLEHYMKEMSIEQLSKIVELGKKAYRNGMNKISKL